MINSSVTITSIPAQVLSAEFQRKRIEVIGTRLNRNHQSEWEQLFNWELDRGSANCR